MLLDLHCHSLESDGSLTVQQLAAMAINNEFRYFAITDHDSLKPNVVLEACLEESDVQFVSGIEFSTTWNGNGIHIVGLNFDYENPELIKAVDFQKQSRFKRAQIISERLEKIGLSYGLEKILESKSKNEYIGRPDFAKLLLKEGMVDDLGQAYKKHLGAGKRGDVKSQWLDLEKIISTIRNSSGISVLAHPLHYKFTNSKLNRLFSDFKNLHGDSIEVISGFQNPDKTNYLKSLCNKFEFLASIGSDFHQPSSWKHLGCDANLVENTEPIWNHFVAR